MQAEDDRGAADGERERPGIGIGPEQQAGDEAPRIEPAMPSTIVVQSGMGSRPGMARRASSPTIRPPIAAATRNASSSTLSG
jgi:hypothetical protein